VHQSGGSRAQAIGQPGYPRSLKFGAWRGAEYKGYQRAERQALLAKAPGRTLRMSALATLAEGSLPLLSQVVARLEQRGWVRRTSDPAAARSIELAESTDADHRVVRPAARPGWMSLTTGPVQRRHR
jgi:MarR family